MNQFANIISANMMKSRSLANNIVGNNVAQATAKKFIADGTPVASENDNSDPNYPKAVHAVRNDELVEIVCATPEEEQREIETRKAWRAARNQQQNKNQGQNQGNQRPVTD